MIEILNQIINQEKAQQFLQQSTENEELSDAKIQVKGQELVNFGSCSYLGLEYNKSLKQGVKDAVENYGTQFSSSRSYLSIGLYDELEDHLSGMFGKPVIATASTTLGHLAALPVIVRDEDAVIVDLQVHSSVQMAVQLLKARKVPTYVIPHNSMEALETKIRHLRQKHDKIWYLADGVYSMYGDFAPVHQLETLLNKYKQFHLYIDDAHGMSWTGANGTGYVRSQIEHHPKMILVTSLNKAFASAGGVLVFPDENIKQDVRNCGSTLIFSGPIQPPMLGAAIASAKLHRSSEFTYYQRSLQDKIEFTNRRLKELGLPQVEENHGPLFFIPCGMQNCTANIVLRMKNKGFFLNAAGFPAVPMKKGGIRFTIHENLTFDQIDNMVTTLKQEYVLGLQEEGSSLQEVARRFRLDPINIRIESDIEKPVTGTLSLEKFTSITEVDTREWDALFERKGTSLHHNLFHLETNFSNNIKPENNWKFFYNIIRDEQGKIVIAGYYTSVLMMDDMLSKVEVSRKVKDLRKEDPYFLTSRTILSGSPFTKGDTLYIDFEHTEWKEALELFVKQMQDTAEQQKASKVIIREISACQKARLKEPMLEFGMIEQKLPNNCVVENLAWNTIEEYKSQFNQKYRYSLKKEILKFQDQFVVDYSKPSTLEEQEDCYRLYQQVYQKANNISVFELPFKVFRLMCEREGYDIIRLYLKDDPETPVAVMFSFINQGQYNAMLVGLDYDYVRKHNTYKQILFQTVLRARDLGCSKVDLAFTAEMEKKKVGARIHEMYGYSLALDHYNYAVLESVA